jgi:dTDP-4-amino-4,6-dideoxygalactose transaminase
MLARMSASTPASPKIPIARPLLDDAELQAVAGPLTDGWVVQGPRVRAFEERFAAFVGAPHAIAVSSCTTALHLALVALGVGPGDEVVVPALTWVATANVVEMCGARPVFCDIDPATWNVNAEGLSACLGPRTRAIIVVHLFGRPADMTAIMALAERHGVPVVEDAACGFGAVWNGRHVGLFGATGCFSFHPRKAITTGEGGMLTTESAALAERYRSLRDHGASKPRDVGGPFLLPAFEEVGYNYRLTDIQAAVGVAQMDKADRILEGRRRFAARYDRLLEPLDWLVRPAGLPEHARHGQQSYVCRFAPPGVDDLNVLHAGRNRLMAALDAEGIQTRQGTHAVTLLDVYARKYDLRPDAFPGAWIGDRLSLALPLFPQMTEGEHDRVVEMLTTLGP